MELRAVDSGGPGPLVLLLHGVSGSAGTYAWLPGALGPGRRYVALDLRGHGASPHAPGTYEVETYAADVIAWLEADGGGPAALVGHSLGGVVAWTVAQRRPDLVTGAFLEDSPLYLGEPAEHETNVAVPRFRAIVAAVERWRAAGTSAAEVAAFIGGRPDAAVLAPDVPAAQAQALLAMDPGVLDAAIDSSALVATDVEAPVDVPVAVLAGDEAFGAVFAARHEARLAATHPDATVVRLGGVGHLIHDDRVAREIYVEALRAFLDRVAPA